MQRETRGNNISNKVTFSDPAFSSPAFSGPAYFGPAFSAYPDLALEKVLQTKIEKYM